MRYMSEHAGNTVLSSASVTVADAGFALLAPAVVTAGTPLEVTWRGPGAEYDYVAIAVAGSAESIYLEYRYLSDGNPVVFTAPGTPGEYELRYANDSASDVVLFSVPFTVEAAGITLNAPESVSAGSSFEVSFTVTDRAEWDYITIVPVGAEDGAWLDYAYIYDSTAVTLTAPAEPGSYEIRYASDSRIGTFARRPIEVR